MSDPLRILLVEDEPAIADAVVWSLGQEGFQVAWASIRRIDWNRRDHADVADPAD